MPLRCVILPPAPVPYREPLFALLAERGRIDPTVVYLSGDQPGWDQSPDWFPSEHPYPSVSLRSAQHRRQGRTPVLFPRRLGKALGELDPEVVVSWEYGAATLRSLAWAGRRRRPLVIFSELTPAAAADLSAGRRRLQPLLAQRAAGFVAASSAAAGRLEALGVDPHGIEVSVQSADVERFRSAAASGAARREGRVRLLVVARLVPDKNHSLLLRAFAQADLGEEAELVLVGEGPLEGALRAEAERLRVPVSFRGGLAPSALPEAMAGADALLLVSLYEPFGAAVREAAAAGLPLVVSRLAGAAGDVAVEGENALLVDPRSGEEVAAALARVVREPELRRSLAEGSRRVTERRPLEADAEAFERALLRSAGAE